jgi:SAM-dependent methyltransferase
MKEQMINEEGVELESVKCGLCGSGDKEDVLSSCNIKQGCGREYKIVKCLRCGLVFSNPRPTKESMCRYYLDTDPEKIGRRPALYERFYFDIFRRIPIDRKGRVLDVGCGSGRYIYTLKEKGWDVKGIDVGYTDYGRDVLGLDIEEGDIIEKHFAPESFDAVTFWWSLEHMYRPLDALKESYRILKKGGAAVISVHNIDSMEFSIFGRYWFHLFLPKHLYHFSPKTLTMMLKNAGFDRIRIRHDAFSFGIFGSLQCFLNSKGIRTSFTNPMFYALSLPIDMIVSLFNRSGLITVYAFK